ncbi:thioredoxin domain-containing protein [Halocella sp. SP3-1]|uniref:thioredoxin TrxA n=1 Tax=Halocella sp. SP3-1 TaxID=2382161 RepID=UPI000F761A9E|nr:thioredoxin domain-containing protein [Halocella sp. SP3-1]AZO94739.1 thioredoxin [Halocella sp. SP3-1]
MVKLTKENFEEEVLNSEGIVLVDFWSESCDLCLEIMPGVEKLAEKYSDNVKFTKLNIKGNRRLAMGQKVMGLPSILIYVDGEKKVHLSGEDLEVEAIEAELKKVL